MTLKQLLAVLMLCFTSHILFAANESITGTVVDEAGTPLEFVNVTLLTSNDSTLIDGTVTDINGNFSLLDSPKTSFLRISAMGFEEKNIHNPHGTLGNVKLSHVSY